jgi:flagellin-like protein
MLDGELMKGISPMIAIILLIAFTVAVGGILSVWFSTTTTSQTGITGSAATNYTKCGGVGLSIQSASSTLIRYANPSIQNITGIQFIATDGISSWTIIPIGSQFLIPSNVSTVAWTKGTNVSLTALAYCLGSVPIGGRCDNTMSCWTTS